MTDWKLLANETPPLWTKALCWRADWSEPVWLEWKENARIVRDIARGLDNPEGVVPVYFGDIVESDDYEAAIPDNFPTHWLTPSLPGAAGESAPLTIINAMRRIQDAIGKHIRPDPSLTKDEFIDVVLAAADDREVVKAMDALKEQREFLDSFNRQVDEIEARRAGEPD